MKKLMIYINKDTESGLYYAQYADITTPDPKAIFIEIDDYMKLNKVLEDIYFDIKSNDQRLLDDLRLLCDLAKINKEEVHSVTIADDFSGSQYIRL